MRLLTRDTNGKLTTQPFTDHDTPPYAILSHTWDPNPAHELTLEDIQSGINFSSEECMKVRFLENQAQADSLHHFWLDTCCIDQTNPSEVSQALNSMWHYFASASKCYVFLSDVSIDANRVDDTTFVNEAIRSSKWFTRTWTLIELLASSKVEFFSSSGEKVGDKISLAMTIHDVTGIPEDVLLGSKKISEYAEGERMKWAIDRECTRAEDAAYALLGLFEVNMEISYGEGCEVALQRLKTCIKTSIRARTLQDFDKYSRISGTLPNGRKYASFIPKGLHYMLDRSDACFYCGKVGHYEDGCYTSAEEVKAYRREAGLCFQCGSGGHDEEFCPWGI